MSLTKPVQVVVRSSVSSCIQQMGWPNYVQEIIIGVVIVLAVAADRYRSSKGSE